MTLSRDAMDRKIDEHFRFEAQDNVEACWRRWRRTSSTTSSAGRPGRRGGRKARADVYETLFADLSDGKVTCVKRLYGENFPGRRVAVARQGAGAAVRPRRQGATGGIPPAACRRIRGERRHRARERLDRPRGDPAGSSPDGRRTGRRARARTCSAPRRG
ncbi:MAG: hypothetical protein WDM81_05990 [Rhizomicrobium sp.]